MRGDEGRDDSKQGRFDALIDAALRSYAEPGEISETPIALARVMHRARAEEAARRRAWVWGWAVAAACAVVLLVVLGSMWTVRERKTPEIGWTPNATEGAGTKAEPGKGAGAEASAGLEGDSARSMSCPATKACGTPATGRKREAAGIQLAMSHEERELPKLEVFPTPRPLTAQEQALAAFAQQGSPEAKRQVVEAQVHWGDPIAIAELKIAPLESGNKDSNRDFNKER